MSYLSQLRDRDLHVIAKLCRLHVSYNVVKRKMATTGNKNTILCFDSIPSKQDERATGI